ncbi:Regulatory protein Spx [invertebrate metagenome]|uniref:Regulatory protein Spx n=1 Tax=invertebrate metagenome TaxID=1711999 RepID=A0A2H9TBF8_9ZZZZ
MIILYGISNCDTVRKARKWLDSANVDYQFYDYRKNELDKSLLTQWVEHLGWENLLNRRSSSWRQLTEEQKSNLSEKTAIALMHHNPTLIKRPILCLDKSVHVGFDQHRYQTLLAE